MALRTSEASWQGTLQAGSGMIRLGSSSYEVSFPLRSEEGKGSDPVELLGAAHAGCFSMYLSALLSEAGSPPRHVHTTASVHLEAGPAIRKIELHCEADVPGLDEAKFQELVAMAKRGCPVTKALAAVEEITLSARLVR